MSETRRRELPPALTEEELESMANSPDLNLDMEEMTIEVLEEPIKRQTGNSGSSRSDPNSPPPQIPQWFKDAYNDF